MNPEKMMDAISEISDKYIEKYAVVEPVKHDRLNHIVIQRKWFYRLCACLAAVIAIAVCIGIPIRNNTFPQHPFILTAYALDNNNTVIAQDMKVSIQIPITPLEVDDGSKGFLFSIDCASDSPVLTAVTGDESKYGDNFSAEISGVNLEAGKHYFFFAGKVIDNFEDVTFSYTDTETGSTFEICIRIAKQSDGYSASLQELKTFPVKPEHTD